MTTIPDLLLEDIFVRCDAKTIANSRLVSKTWCSILTDKRFISKHAKNSSAKRVLFSDGEDGTTYTVSDSLRRQEQEMRIWTFQWPQYIVGTCNGLLLGLNEDQSCFILTNVLTKDSWRHPLRLFQRIFWPKERSCFIGTYGFGCNPSSGDFKALCIGHRGTNFNDLESDFRNDMMVAIYNLTKNTRRLILKPYLDMQIEGTYGVLVNEKFLHWIASTQPGFISRIISFNLENETFSEIAFPKALEITYDLRLLRLVALGDKLGLFFVRVPLENNLWLLEDYNDPNSWKNFTFEDINLNDTEPIEEIINGELIFGNQEILKCYNIEENRATATVILGEESLCSLHSRYTDAFCVTYYTSKYS